MRRTFGHYTVEFTGRGWAVFRTTDWRCVSTPEPGDEGKANQIERARSLAKAER